MQQSYDDGKYTVTFNDKTGELKALRHGEPWKDLSGDKLTYCMLAAHADAQSEIARLRGALSALELSANTVARCYTHRPENFASALQSLESDASAARELLK